MAMGSLSDAPVVYGSVKSRDVEAFVAAPAASRSDKRRFMAIASAITIALAITALVFVATGSDGAVSASQASYTLAEPKRVALAQMMMGRTTALEGEEPAAEEPAAEEPAAEGEESASAQPLKEPGFVIATTDDSSPPPVTEGTTFHHIKNFAGTEQMMNNGG